MGTTDPSAYMVDAKVYQLGRGSEKSSQNNGGENVVLKEYEFRIYFQQMCLILTYHTIQVIL